MSLQTINSGDLISYRTFLKMKNYSHTVILIFFLFVWRCLTYKAIRCKSFFIFFQLQIDTHIKCTFNSHETHGSRIPCWIQSFHLWNRLNMFGFYSSSHLRLRNCKTRKPMWGGENKYVEQIAGFLFFFFFGAWLEKTLRV